MRQFAAYAYAYTLVVGIALGFAIGCTGPADQPPAHVAGIPVHGSAVSSIQVEGVQFVIAITNQSNPSAPDQAVLRQAAAEITSRVAGDTWHNFTVDDTRTGLGAFLVTVRASPANPSQEDLSAMAAEFSRRVGKAPGSSEGDAVTVYVPVSAAALVAVLRDLGGNFERRTDTTEIAESIRMLFTEGTSGEIVNVDREAALGLAGAVAARESVSPQQIAAELSRLIEPTGE